MLRLTKHKNNHLELHLGPWFRGFISTFSGFLVVSCMAISGIILAKDLISNPSEKYLTIAVLLGLAGIFVNPFLGYEGVEFDLEKRTFRKYVKRFGVKFGNWKSLESYTMLCLSAQYNSIGRSPNTTADNGKHRSLEINLASLNDKSVLLAECKNYKHAATTLEKLNYFLQLEVRDFVKQDYIKTVARR